MNFKKDAADHQKEFFKENLQDPNNYSRTRAQEHWLNESAAARGENFYEDYEVFNDLEDVEIKPLPVEIVKTYKRLFHGQEIYYEKIKVSKYGC